jgi:hypothetical protein
MSSPEREREREGGGQSKGDGSADEQKQQTLSEYYDDTFCRQFSGTYNKNSLSMAFGVKLNVSTHCYTEI